MIKKTKNISIHILTALVVLFCILLSCIGVGNAWFTSEQKRGIQVVVQINEYNIVLTQVKIVDESEVETEVYTNKKNQKEQSSNYIELDQELLPEEFVNVKLKLKNEDAGGSVFLRFNFELYICGVTEDTLVPINITLGEDFIEKNNGFYYVNKDNSNKAFVKNASTELMSGFTIPYSSFKTLQGGETVKLKLTIECVDVNLGF